VSVGAAVSPVGNDAPSVATRATDAAVKVNLVVAGGDGAGGQGRYVDSLYRALRDQRIDVRLAPFRYPPLAGRRPILELLPIGVEGAGRGEVIHLVRIKGASMLLARRAWRSVITVHDLGITFCPEDRVLVSSPIRREGLRLSLVGMRRAERVIAVSDFTRRCLIRAGFDPARVTTVHEGVDGDRFRPIPGARGELDRRYGLGLAPADHLLVYVGNELPRKNLATLVDALGRLRRAGVPFRWLKVGAPQYGPGRTDLLRRIEQHGLCDRVTIIDHVPEADLPLVYAAASAYVQPSLWEGFGLPVLEAMAAGVPVVAADATALPEVCGDAAVLVDPRDATAWADRLGELLVDDGERSRRAALGRERAAGFTWAETARRTGAVYRALTTA
jgi:glycosyltransferase involved in cell wall biosynthesis